MDRTRRAIISCFGAGAAGIMTGLGGAMPASGSETPELPWTYVKLDPEETRKLGHELCYASNCASGAFKAILVQLIDKVGYPYNQVPLNIFNYGGGGVTGWGTVCGALNGAGGAITLAAGKAQNDALMTELLGWYTLQAFPSDESNDCAAAGGYAGDRAVSQEVLAQSVSESPLCHVSVTTWCRTAGKASKSPERAERCARVTGDVAAKAVELLNAVHDDTFVPKFELPAEVTSCTSCHKVGTVYAAGHNTIGKMSCLQCHDSHF